MNLQLNDPWLTDMKSPSGVCAAAGAAALKPGNNSTAVSAATGARASHGHGHLELTLGMPSSCYTHHHSTEPKPRPTGAAPLAAPLLFAAHGASALVVADKSYSSSSKPSPGAHAASLLLQMPGCSASTTATTTCGLGTKRWFSETSAVVTAAGPSPPASAAAPGVGFVHPWSLAARQEKAALEQAARAMVATNQPSAPPTLLAAASRPTTQPPPVVGWPPIRTYRKNVITNPPRMQKTTTTPAVGDADADSDDEAKEAKKSKPSDSNEEKRRHQASGATEEMPPNNKPSTMFVKVNMEGFAVGRKIDLMAHHGYGSLSCAIHKMFDNFLSVKNAKLLPTEKDSAATPDLVLLYEDNEGDRMLVGDVPWEMFVASVKRLYISVTPNLHGPAGEDQQKTTKDSESLLT